MVQVDVLITFAIGSTFAIAAKDQLIEEVRPFHNKYFTLVLLYFSIIFVPIGVYLLARHPGWESMFLLYPYLVDVELAAKGIIPASSGIIAAVLSTLYVLSGCAGYYIAYKFIRKGKAKLAHVLWIVAMGMVCLISIVGWDGTGFERVTYAGNWYEWHQWKVMGGVNKYVLADYFKSSQFYSLLGVVGVAIPPVLYIYHKFYYKWGRN